MGDEVDGVGAAGDERRGDLLEGVAGADEHGADLHAELVGELAGAAEQLEADLGRHAVVLLDDDPDIVALHAASSLRCPRR